MQQPSPLAALSDALSGLVAQAAPAVVAVHSHRARSSGFVWRNSFVVTADEALAEEGEISVILPGGQAIPARIAGRDPGTDIAVLRIDHPDLPPFGLSPAGAPVGSLAVVLGSRDGAPTAALGLVAQSGGPWHSARGGEIDARIELGVTLRSASEGGPVLDPTGALIGMAVFGPRRRVLVIPAATIDRVGNRLATHGRIARGYLGLALQPVGVDGQGAGAIVMSVDANGPGAAAGLHQGDVIIGWDGQPLGNLRHLLRGLSAERIGTNLALQILRGGAPATVAITIGERPTA